VHFLLSSFHHAIAFGSSRKKEGKKKEKPTANQARNAVMDYYFPSEYHFAVKNRADITNDREAADAFAARKNRSCISQRSHRSTCASRCFAALSRAKGWIDTPIIPRAMLKADRFTHGSFPRDRPTLMVNALIGFRRITAR